MYVLSCIKFYILTHGTIIVLNFPNRLSRHCPDCATKATVSWKLYTRMYIQQNSTILGWFPYSLTDIFWWNLINRKFNELDLMSLDSVLHPLGFNLPGQLQILDKNVNFATVKPMMWWSYGFAFKNLFWRTSLISFAMTSLWMATWLPSPTEVHLDIYT